MKLIHDVYEPPQIRRKLEQFWQLRAVQCNIYIYIYMYIHTYIRTYILEGDGSEGKAHGGSPGDHGLGKEAR